MAEDALAVRDEVLGIVAHDLRSPLTAVAMKAALIQRTTDPGAALRQARSIESIAARMDLLIKALLDAAALQAGRFDVSPAPWEARGLLEDVVDVFGSQAEAKSVHLHVRLDDPSLRVVADRERIAQALGNLVANAVKFTPRAATSPSARRRAATTSASPSPTTARAFRPGTCRTCSSVSGRESAGASGGRGSASTSRRASSRRTAA